MLGILGRKIGMTRIFSEKGMAIPVTVIKAGPCSVINHRKEEKEGYIALQISFGKKKKANKPIAGLFQKMELEPGILIKEVRVNREELEKYPIGSNIDVDIFKKGDYVDVTGKSIGKGFQGVIKRHHFKGGPATHGSMSHRTPGSIGSTDAAHVWKGTRMAGHMGNRKVTIQNLKVIEADKEKGILILKGGVAGSRNNLLLIKKAIKK